MLLRIGCAFLFCSAGFSFAAAQDEEKGGFLTSERVVANRPATSAPKRSTARYRRVSKDPKPKGNAAQAVGTTSPLIGITTWRFRPAGATDKTKELVEEDGNDAEYTLERIEEGTPLSPGQKVRLSVESLSRDGYLYVIDREQYADGTMGRARLIFPTARTQNGNQVKVGQLIYIPPSPRYFKVNPSQTSKVQVAEILMILVSPRPLIESSSLTTTALVLPPEQVRGWEKQWGKTASKFEMDGGAGQTMTDKEQAAGNDSSEPLTQDDPTPQTVLRVAIKPDDPILVTVRLQFRKP
jgi:hypothetical protein